MVSRWLPIRQRKTYLEEYEPVVQLSLLRPTIETHAARVKQHAYESEAEEVIWHVDRHGNCGRGCPLAVRRTCQRCQVKLHVNAAYDAQR
jgi:hypothetical protein